MSKIYFFSNGSSNVILTFSRRRPLSYRNQSIDLQSNLPNPYSLFYQKSIWALALHADSTIIIADNELHQIYRRMSWFRSWNNETKKKIMIKNHLCWESADLNNNDIIAHMPFLIIQFKAWFTAFRLNWKRYEH